MKNLKLAAVAAAAAMCCSLIPQFTVMADTASDDVLMVCDFENGANLPVVSTGSASYEETASPMASTLNKIAPSTATQATEAAIEANVAAWKAANLENIEKNNTVLKLSGAAANDVNTVTIYEGKLPEAFGLDFSVLGLPSFANFVISAEQDGKSYILIRYDQWTSSYLTDSKTRYAMNSTGMWSPHTMIFEDFASDNTKLKMYLNGRLNYSATAANPQDYANAYKELGSYYQELDLSKDVKIELKATGAMNSLYFDNFRLYRYNKDISNEAGSDFDNETISMLPMQNGIRTGGFIGRQWLYLDANKTQQNYGLIGYQSTVEADPLDPSNKVLYGVRGEGSNEYSYDNAVRFYVNKPKEKLTIKFKALTNGTYNIATDIADGIFEDVFYMTESKTPADRIFTLNQNANGQFVSSGRYNGYFASNVNWELDKWNDVTIIYDVKENKTSFNINGVEFGVIPNPNGEIISKIMASEQEAITINIFRPYPSTGKYLMLDDISIISDNGNETEEPTPTPEPSAISVTEAQPLVKADTPEEQAGLFWNVTLSDLSRDTVKGTFTDGEKKLEKTFDLSNITGDGSAVFSVMMIGAPDGVVAEFE